MPVHGCYGYEHRYMQRSKFKCERKYGLECESADRYRTDHKLMAVPGLGGNLGLLHL